MEEIRHHAQKLWPVVEAQYEAQLEGWTRLNHKVLKIARPVTYPLKRLIEAWRATNRFGSIVEELANLSKMRQLLNQLILYARYGLPPTAYYKFQLFRRARWEEAPFYVHHKQMDVLTKGIVILSGAHAEASLLRNKLRFFEHCRNHDIATPSILLAFQGGGVVSGTRRGERLPRRDLFSKPIEGERGLGCRRWTFRADEDVYWDGTGKMFAEEELRNLLKKRSKDRGIIVQERLRNHPKLKTLAGEPLCAMRMITGRKPEGNARHLISTIRMADHDGGVTSNFSDGGIAAPVQPDTGHLGVACYRKIGAGPMRCHPATGKKIVEFELPGWESSVHLAERAHDTLSRLPFVGWDIVFTEAGPLILEGNSGFGGEVLQIPHRCPLGRTDFAEYYSDWLDHLGGDV